MRGNALEATSRAELTSMRSFEGGDLGDAETQHGVAPGSMDQRRVRLRRSPCICRIPLVYFNMTIYS